MNLFVKNKIYQHIHVETSQKCNLACPMCPRESLLEKILGIIKAALSRMIKTIISINKGGAV